MRWISLVCLLLALAMLTGSSPVKEDPEYTIGICSELKPTVELSVPVPASSRACSKDNRAWKIRLYGPLADSVTISFDDLRIRTGGAYLVQYISGKEVKSLGEINQSQEVNFKVGKGQSLLLGLHYTEGDIPPVAVLTAHLNKEKLNFILNAGGAEAYVRRALIVEVEQKCGAETLLADRFIYNVSFCSKGNRDGDKIAVSNSALGDNTVVLLDVKRGGLCVPDELWRTTGVRDVGDIMRPDVCRSEAVVFSKGDAVKIVENVSIWSNQLGDRLDLDLSPDSLEIPVTIFIMRSPFEDAVKAALTHMVEANAIYENSRCGIRFVTSEDQIVNVTEIARKEKLLDASCGQAVRLMQFIPPRPNRLNIYYTEEPGAYGIWCILPKFGMISSYARPDTLAHEFGHSLSLGSSEGYLGPKNLMYEGGGLKRERLTLGQCFRCNVQQGSILADLGMLRVTPRRCSIGVMECPDIVLDVP